MGFKEEALLTMKNLENQAKNIPKAYICMDGHSKAKKLDVVTSEGQYYHFDQFSSHMTFLYLQKILKIRQIENKLNLRSKIIGVMCYCQIDRNSAVISKSYLWRMFQMMKTQVLKVVTYQSMSSYFWMKNPHWMTCCMFRFSAELLF